MRVKIVCRNQPRSLQVIDLDTGKPLDLPILAVAWECTDAGAVAKLTVPCADVEIEAEAKINPKVPVAPAITLTVDLAEAKAVLQKAIADCRQQAMPDTCNPADHRHPPLCQLCLRPLQVLHGIDDAPWIQEHIAAHKVDPARFRRAVSCACGLRSIEVWDEYASMPQVEADGPIAAVGWKPKPPMIACTDIRELSAAYERLLGRPPIAGSECLVRWQGENYELLFDGVNWQHKDCRQGLPWAEFGKPGSGQDGTVHEVNTDSSPEIESVRSIRFNENDFELVEKDCTLQAVREDGTPINQPPAKPNPFYRE